jgi:hypothetical protein
MSNDWLSEVDELGCWGWSMAGALARGTRLPPDYFLTAGTVELREKILELARAADAARRAGDMDAFRQMRGRAAGLIEGELFDAAEASYLAELDRTQRGRAKAMLYRRRQRMLT